MNVTASAPNATYHLPGFAKIDTTSGDQSVSFGDLGTVASINTIAMTGSDEEKSALNRKMARTTNTDLIKLITNPSVSEGIRGIALSMFKVSAEANAQVSGSSGKEEMGRASGQGLHHPGLGDGCGSS